MEEQLAYLIASVNHHLEEDLAETLRPDGLPIEQFRILNALSSRNGRSMRDLAAVVLVDPGTLTKIVDRMVVDAMVYRGLDPEDRRKVLIFFAPKGKALYNKLKGVLSVQQSKLVGRLSRERIEALTLSLREIIRPEA